MIFLIKLFLKLGYFNHVHYKYTSNKPFLKVLIPIARNIKMSLESFQAKQTKWHLLQAVLVF